MNETALTHSDARIVIDVSAVHPTAGGGHTYAHILSRSLPGAGIDPLCLARVGDAAEDWDGCQVLPLVPASRVRRLVWEQTSMLRALERHAPNASVLHSIHYTMPERPTPARLARIVTIHDLTVFTHPERHEPAKRLFFRRAIGRAARFADQLICVSETTARELLRLVDVRVPIDVIPHGVDLLHFSPSEPTVGADAAILAEMGIERPYALHLGTIEPRKNVARFIDAVARHNGGADGLDVVLVGGAWTGEREALPKPEGLRIHHLGIVRDAAVPALLRSAAVVAYPSLAEGFGLPIIEALACGTPVVTSRDSVMSELAPDAAMVVDPLSVADLAEAIGRAVGGFGPPIGVRLAAAARFDRHECARRHAEVYRRFLSV